jgi:hypothetical protein
LVLTGVGQGMFQTPNARALMNAVPPGKHGEASGLLATGRVVGQSLSVALAGAIFASLGGASAGRALVAKSARAVAPGDIAALQQAFLTGFKGALMVCAAVAAAGLLATLIRGDEQQRAGVAVGPAGALHEPVAPAPGALHVRVWDLMSRGGGPRTG